MLNTFFIYLTFYLLLPNLFVGIQIQALPIFDPSIVPEVSTEMMNLYIIRFTNSKTTLLIRHFCVA